MMIGFRRCIDQDPLSRLLGLAIYKNFMNHTGVFSYHDPCICARFYARLKNEGPHVYPLSKVRTIMRDLFLNVVSPRSSHCPTIVGLVGVSGVLYQSVAIQIKL